MHSESSCKTLLLPWLFATANAVRYSSCSEEIHCYPFGFWVFGYCNLSGFFSHCYRCCCRCKHTVCVWYHVGSFIKCNECVKRTMSSNQRLCSTRLRAKEWQQHLLGQHRFVILILHSFFLLAIASSLPFMLDFLSETCHCSATVIVPISNSLDP